MKCRTSPPNRFSNCLRCSYSKAKMPRVQLFLVLSLFFLSGCASNQARFEDCYVSPAGMADQYDINRVDSDVESFIQLTSDRCVTKLYGNESQFKQKRHKGPQLGLALSGGGVRSASFSIGALKALHQLGILDQVDVLSTVSGGSYAAYWLYSQLFHMHQLCDNYHRENCAKPTIDEVCSLSPAQYEAATISCQKKAPEDLFGIFDTFWYQDDPLKPLHAYRFQAALEHRSELLKTGDSFLGDTPRLIGVIGSQIGFFPIHFLTNFVFDLDHNWFKPVRFFYQSTLDGTYGLVPLDLQKEKFQNSYRWLKFGRLFAEPITFKELGDFVKAKHLPFWIVNMRGEFGSDIYWKTEAQKSLERPIYNTNYEFTLLQHGSELFGYRKYSYSNPLTVSDAIVTSGAALDSVAEEFKKSALGAILDVSNTDLGVHISNPNRHPIHRFIHSIIPFPLYLIDDALWAKKTNTIYLSDGGYAENLGLFSLIRRGVKKIIVVDAELDPNSSFSAAIKLRDALKKELGLLFELQSTSRAFDVMNPPKTFLRGSVRRNSDECNKSSRRLDETLPTQRSDIEPIHQKADCKVSDIFYFKLAMRRDQDDEHLQSGAELPDYHIHTRRQAKKSFDFPHESTVDINYNPIQFRAYRSLAMDLVCHAGPDLNNFLNNSAKDMAKMGCGPERPRRK